MNYDTDGAPPTREAVLLTGGASRRMGQDKSRLFVGDEELAVRLARELRLVCRRVTVLGREAVDGCDFLADVGEFEGPLAAIARFRPSAQTVFVASCDMPRFDSSVVIDLAERLGTRLGAVPIVEGREQPLCALYRAEAIEQAAEAFAQGERRIMTWLKGLQPVFVLAESLSNPSGVLGANTPEELRAILEG